MSRPLPGQTDLAELVAAELAEPVDPRVAAMAAAIADHHPSAMAVLFYGSCLREAQLDGLMLDFYLIVGDYRAAYPGSRWLAAANRLIPPNVFPYAQGALAAKYAVLSMADFARLCSLEADNASVWARFAQPSRLVWTHDDAARDAAIAAVAQAAPTLFALAAPVSPDPAPMAIWQTGFARTYATELRAERSSRSGTIVDADPARYARFGAVIGSPRQALTPAGAARRWQRLRRRGKWLSVIRLAKASFTFSGGIDYLAWKINRHAGTQIRIKPWQRRFPLIAAIVLVPRLIARGAVK